MELKVNRYSDAGAFLQATESWLATAEVENNVILSIARSVADGSRTLKEPPYFAAAVDGDGIVCCATRTPPHVLLVTDGTSSGLAALAGDVFDAMGSLPGVVGPYKAPAAFADAWLPLAGARGSVSMRQRLYKIDRVNAGLTGMQGRLREATPADRDLALEWCTAFAREAVPNHPSDAEDTVDRHLKCRTLYFWDDGRPVTMSASPPGSARINLVYTPPDLRRRGYATAAVATLSRQLLESGRQYCCLYADLANPISNSIYQQIGYRPVCDFEEYEFAEQ
jgi:RimJ/RimL family protein N-acetyltransferase